MLILQSAGLRGPQPRRTEARKHSINTHASAHPAAEAISEKGRSRRRSVKNRRPFDCFKSAEGIRFSVGARTTPESFHRGGFWCYLLSEQKVTYEKIIERMRLIRVARAASSRSGDPNNFAAKRRYLRRLAQSALPPAAEDKFYPKLSVCGSLSRAVRRRPTAAVAFQPLSANSPHQPLFSPDGSEA